MSSPSAIPDSNPTRAQLRLVVLGQWVQAGLALARGAAATRGLLGGAVALWQVFQAIRLAIQLAQRLSALNEALARAEPERESAETPVQGSAPWPDVAPVAACLRQALIEIGGTIREALALGLGAGLSARPGAGAAAQPGRPRPLGRRTPSLGRRPIRPPGPERSRAGRPRPPAFGVPTTIQPPIAAPAIGRFRLGAGLR